MNVLQSKTIRISTTYSFEVLIIIIIIMENKKLQVPAKGWWTHIHVGAHVTWCYFRGYTATATPTTGSTCRSFILFFSPPLRPLKKTQSITCGIVRSMIVG